MLRVRGQQWNVGIGLSGQVKGNTKDFSKEWRDLPSSCPGNESRKLSSTLDRGQNERLKLKKKGKMKAECWKITANRQ